LREWLKIFSQEGEQEMSIALEFAAEEETNSMDFVELYEKLESIDIRVMVQSLNI
jgi:rubrerythrin